MSTLTQILTLGALAAGIVPSSAVPRSPTVPAIAFDEARILLEFNATDGDAEVVVEVDADTGLERFHVFDPLGRSVLSLSAKDSAGLGIRKIALETPEPSLEDVLAAYPAGCYTFTGKSVDGERLLSFAWLSHELPQAPEITYPLEGATNVPTSGAAATWTAGPDAASFFLELENDDLAVDLEANLSGGTLLLGFPQGFLAADTEYQLGVAARAATGNLTVVELDFSTAP